METCTKNFKKMLNCVFKIDYFNKNEFILYTFLMAYAISHKKYHLSICMCYLKISKLLT